MPEGRLHRQAEPSADRRRVPSSPADAYIFNARFVAVNAIVFAVLVPAIVLWVRYQVRENASGLLERAERLESEQQWSKSAEYYHRYLLMQPQDAHARRQLARVYDRSASSSQSRRRAAQLYAVAAAANPNDLELICRQAEILVELGRSKEAMEVLEDFSARSEARGHLEDHIAAKVHRIRALAFYQLVQQRGGPSLGQQQRVFALMEKARKENPHDLDVAAASAEMYRECSSEPSDQYAQSADRVINDMVARNADNPDAYVIRYLYRLRYHWKTANNSERNAIDKDLDRALAHAPNQPRLVLLAGERAMRKGDYSEAIRFYRRYTELKPDDHEGYLGLASAQFLAADDEGLEQAISIWRKGLNRVDADDIPLNLQLAGGLLNVGRLDEANQCIRRVESAIRRSRHPPSEEARTVLAWLRANLALRNGDVFEGIRLLKLAVAVQGGQPPHSELWYRRAWALLGHANSWVHRWDEAATAFLKAARLGPAEPEFSLLAARAWMAIGRYSEAQAILQAIPSHNPVPKRWLLLAELELARQNARHPTKPDWSRCREYVDRARAQHAPDPDCTLVEVAMLLQEQQYAVALQRLEKLVQVVGESPRILLAIAECHEAAGHRHEAEAVLRKFDALIQDQTRALLFRVDIMARSGKLAEAIELLNTAIPSLASRDRRMVEFQLAQLYLGKGDRQRGVRLLNSLSRRHPDDFIVLRQLIRLALLDGNRRQLKVLADRMRRIEGDDGCYWRLALARYWLMNSPVDATRLSHAKQLQREIEQLRPNWYEAYLLAASIAELEDQPQEALIEYERGGEFGAPPLLVARGRAACYAKMGRIEMARDVVDEHVDQARTDPAFGLVAVAVYRLAGRSDVAASIARDLAHKYPDDPRLLASFAENLQWRDPAQASEAKQALLRAAEMAPSSVSVHAMLVKCLVATGHENAARRVITRFRERAKLPPADLHLAVARLQSLVGEWAAVEKEVKAAIAAGNSRVDILISAAELYASHSLDESVRILRIACHEHPHLDSPKRALATALSRIGTPEHQQEALRLLEQLKHSRATQAGLDRLISARIHEASGNIRRAREEFYRFAYTTPTPLAYEIVIRFLLRNQEVDAAATWLKKLEMMAPSAIPTVELGVRIMHKKGRTPGEIQERIDRFFARGISEAPPSAEQIQRMAVLARLSGDFGLDTRADALFRQVEDMIPLGYRARAHWLVDSGMGEKAIEICVERMQADPANVGRAVILCEVLVAACPETFPPPGAERLVMEALSRHPHHQDLLLQFGHLKLKQDDLAAAETAYRSVLNATPHHTIALNNLAIVLAHDPRRLGAAMECIDLALERAGRESTLLATKALLQLLDKKPLDALRTIHESYAKGPIDPQNSFCLAAALLQTGDSAAAARALERARMLGLSDLFLTRIERQVLANLERRLPHPSHVVDAVPITTTAHRE